MRRPTETRRSFIKKTAAATAATLIGAPAVHANARKVTIGYVTPSTGPLAAFAEVDQFIIDGFLKAVAGGIKSGSRNYSVEVILKDSQSNPNRAAEVAKELIVDDEIDIMVVSHTPETTNPVATICEIEEIPCISTLAPWQPWFIGRQGNPGDPSTWKSFDYTYHFLWGLEDLIAVFTNMWKQIDTNMSVGGLFPNDADGNAWGDPKVGMPPALSQMGFKLTDPGRYENLQDDFSAQISAFKDASCGDRHRRGAATGFRNLLDAGRPAGLPPENCLGRQGHPVPVRRQRDRRRGAESVLGSLVVKCPPVFKSSHQRA